ncbi:ribokinase [Atopobiaceae bacterium SGI.236]|nr:ribokinase [Atopobiaceae bacterium]
MPKVVVFGSMNMDLSIEADRMPRAGETLAGHDFVTNAGGKGANQAVAASRLGADVAMVAAVGVDGFGDELLAGLRSAGVDTSEVERTERATTGVAIIVRTDADNRIVLHPGANVVMGASEACAAIGRVASAGDVLLVQGECDEDATLAAVRHAHDMGMHVLLNPAPARPIPDDVWPCVDMVCLNETECEVMCGVLPHDEKTLRQAAGLLVGLGCGCVVVTLGSRGSYAQDARAVGDARELRVEARRVDAVDTTAAGDTFIGALAAGLAGGRDLAEAMAFGTAAAAITVTRVGAQQSIPTLDEVRLALA